MSGREKRGPKLAPGVMREKVRELYERGLNQRQISMRLGVSRGTVAFHVRRFGVPVDERFARRYDWAEIQRAHDSGLSVRQCAAKFGFRLSTWSKAVQRGDIEARDHRIPLDELLVRDRRTSRGHLKRRLVTARLKEDRCERCGISEWQGEPLNMQLHHRNGDGLDNRLENLDFLCANCHSQTENWGGRNGHRRPSSNAA